MASPALVVVSSLLVVVVFLVASSSTGIVAIASTSISRNKYPVRLPPNDGIKDDIKFQIRNKYPVWHRPNDDIKDDISFQFGLSQERDPDVDPFRESSGRDFPRSPCRGEGRNPTSCTLYTYAESYLLHYTLNRGFLSMIQLS
jgi:hypothetical protein